MRRRLDKVWVGLLLGLVMPVVFGYSFLSSTYSGEVSYDALLYAMSGNSMIIKFMCVMLFPDMGGVFVLNSMEMWSACRGMFASIGIFVIVCTVFLFINM